jgi:predicted transcriptional regulator
MSRTVLGLGPLEAAIMAVAWQPSSPRWLPVPVICDRLDYPRPLAYTTVSSVVAILHGKRLLRRRRGRGQRWEYQAARPLDEHIGQLIADLLDAAPDPPAALACALRRPVPGPASLAPAAGYHAVTRGQVARGSDDVRNPR